MSDRLPELSPRARALIEAARAAEAPRQDDKARIAAALASRLAVPVPVDPTAAASTTAAGGSAAASTGGATATAGTAAAGAGAATAAKAAVVVTTAAKVKLALVVVAASAGGVATYNAVQPEPAEPPVPAIVREQPKPSPSHQPARIEQKIDEETAADKKAEDTRREVIATEARPDRIVRSKPAPTPARGAATPPAVQSDPTDDEPGAPSAAHDPPEQRPAVEPAPTPAVAPSNAAPPPIPEPAVSHPACNTGQEIALLRDVQAALRDKQGRRALRLLGRHTRDCSAGAFGEEARAARVLALCLTGQRSRALTEAKRLLREAPRSPQIARLRTSCAASALPKKHKKQRHEKKDPAR